MWSCLFVVGVPDWAIHELKRYTKNLYYPEASIVERYIAKEVEFCSELIEKEKPIGLPESRRNEKVGGKG